MRVIVDTNVLLSAALRDRLPERVVLHIATCDEIKWVVTPPILAENLNVLRLQHNHSPANKTMQRHPSNS